jgi:phytoene synthase
MISDAITDPTAKPQAAAAMREIPLVALPVQSSSSCGDGDSVDARVALLKERLEEIYTRLVALPAPETRSEPQHVLAAMQDVAEQYQISREHFLDFAEGCRMDRSIVRYATWPSLQEYLDRIAGSVAIAIGCVLGATHSETPRFAVDLGRAMRLTNILRDIAIDAKQSNRLYLPLEDLARFRCGERAILSGETSSEFNELLRFEVERARTLYRQAADGICWLADDGSRLFVASMIAAQSGLLRRIKRGGGIVLHERIALTTFQKLTRLPLAYRLTLRPPGAPACAL